MKWIVLVVALIAGSAGTSRAQVFKPRGKGPLMKKVDLKTPDAKASDPKKPEVSAKAPEAKSPAIAATKKTPTKPGSRVARDSRPDDLTPAPTKKKKVARKKKKKGGDDDDDVKVSDDDDDVKVSDD